MTEVGVRVTGHTLVSGTGPTEVSIKDSMFRAVRGGDESLGNDRGVTGK